MNYETENIEFKASYTDNIYKEIIAFANTEGGTLYIGVDNNGVACGINDIDDVYTRITNGVRDAIVPDITMFIRYELQKNDVIKISVSEGSNKPYYIKAKGLKPSGVYIRQGASCAPASTEQIRLMIRESDGDNYEEMRCAEQNLTFDEAKKAFRENDVVFSRKNYRALGITDSTGDMYTNMALIVSDQCNHTVKVAVYADESNTEFRDTKEFTGSVFEQLNETFSYLMLCNKKTSSIEGLKRFERYDYPSEAIREALLNALVHRDYSFSGSIIVNVNDAQMEFVSLGGLVSGLSTEDISSGISQPRNKNLANVFFRLHLIESYGTGIRRIFKMYEMSKIQPYIKVTDHTFTIVLPNMNYNKANEPQKLTNQEQTIIEYIRENGQITDKEIQDLLNVKRTRAYYLTRKMLDYGLITANGRGSNKKYILAV